jgi:hypothetical protein
MTQSLGNLLRKNPDAFGERDAKKVMRDPINDQPTSNRAGKMPSSSI